MAEDAPFGEGDIGVELVSLPDVFLGRVLAARLEDAGVHAWTIDTRAGGRLMMQGVTVYVRDADLDEARRLMAEFALEDGDDSPWATPEPQAPNAVGRFLNRILGGGAPTGES